MKKNGGYKLIFKKYPAVYVGCFCFVVLKSEISQNFNEIIGEIEKWVKILE
jgi:hypothetical protein